MTFRWLPDQADGSGCPAAHWRMEVRTSQVPEFLAVGYSVAVVGSWADGVARGALDHD
ncbi:hypothetical protein BOQ63_001840 (plasmid) [Streptomyces viridifaciens]|nr:hypothetical protein BOQ63_001840 [Streptomyces viridifaciens]